MEKRSIKVFEGSQVFANLLKGKLEKIGVPSRIQNEFQTSITAGFIGGDPSVVELFIRSTDLEKAKPYIQEFRNNFINNKGN
ncbi:putative signal transducing protein [Xanthovirga aplysinae]|uniref:putative signal transducing protein n=1 Tax=Xanthovirga aplysinae TaxID=2529853 RepID=UPI0012BC0859|nr:DUF2007 domain-containing protein [Xanthovirga aplysinae]MTI29729.1 DUF2007 domain-containing protein [Xanthovirga aplysinae]